MNAHEVKSILLRKSVANLYHVNTVVTALTFINNGGLLSRGLVKSMGLIQTPQGTDEIDERLGVYYDVFFDSVDIHSRIKNVNSYGPVTFVYKISVLDAMEESEVKVTKQNPKYWNDHMSESEKYFETATDLEHGFQLGTFAQEITLCNSKNAISFDCLKEIILENPEISNTSYFDKAQREINDALVQNKITAPLVIRECPRDCKCKEKYRSSKEGYTYHRFKTEI